MQHNYVELQILTSKVKFLVVENVLNGVHEVLSSVILELLQHLLHVISTLKIVMKALLVK